MEYLLQSVLVVKSFIIDSDALIVLTPIKHSSLHNIAFQSVKFHYRMSMTDK